MKPEHRTPEFWERVGRKVCEMTGLDPDERVRMPSDGYATASTGPRWKKPALEAQRLVTLAEAYEAVEDEVDQEAEDARFGPWVKWEGGEPPKPEGNGVIQTRRRSGWVSDTQDLSDFDWLNDGKDYEVVEYRFGLGEVQP